MKNSLDRLHHRIEMTQEGVSKYENSTKILFNLYNKEKNNGKKMNRD